MCHQLYWRSTLGARGLCLLKWPWGSEGTGEAEFVVMNEGTDVFVHIKFPFVDLKTMALCNMLLVPVMDKLS